MADRNLGLAPGASYTQEWAIYPTSDACPDYYCFINAGKMPMPSQFASRVSRCDLNAGFRISARKERWGQPSMRLNGTGFLSMNTNLPYADYSELEDAKFLQPWGNWSNATWHSFLVSKQRCVVLDLVACDRSF